MKTSPISTGCFWAVRTSSRSGAACLSLVLVVVRILLEFSHLHKGAGDTSHFRSLPRSLAPKGPEETSRRGSLAPQRDLVISKSLLQQCLYGLFREGVVSKDADRERIF